MIKPLIFLFLLFGFTCAAAQELKKAELVEEFSDSHCDDFLARADNFFLQLNNNPSAKGYFVIYGNNRTLEKKLRAEAFLNMAATERMSDPSRIIRIRAPETGDLKMQFWLVPAGSDIPELHPANWSFSLPPRSKAFILNTGFAEMCGYPLNPSVVNEFLNANPGMHLNAVIYANSAKSRRKGLMEAKVALKVVADDRIRYFFAKSPGYTGAIVEYWLVPRKYK